ncbi:hypothetical protein BOTBODRAFT_274790 [Botryobasidium botryosum FD-172 SS1]|uniref:F-box domain-containing protein n=1 Tax=Botryobasidium botryosum (strain FD-172 SS1) TaxID=930990 RepID=A0A067MJE9_BOTB1|nr:hypothetical protein BOTBODRAFT_274790 [Botryobasidium botryosum FD-172 SS1]
MAHIPRLDHDILSMIAREISSLVANNHYQLGQRSLLYLALTCRSMRELVIPRFLFARVSITSHPALLSFCRCITAPNSEAGDAVRHLYVDLDHNGGRIPGDLPSEELVGALEKMHQLLSLQINAFAKFYAIEPRIAKAVIRHTTYRLDTLCLDDCSLPSLRLLRDLIGLRFLSISLQSRSRAGVLTSDSPLGVIIMNSRCTLEELRLGNISSWQLYGQPLDTSDTSIEGEIYVWPHIHTLALGGPQAGLLEELDFSYSFPSIRCFEHSFHSSEWAMRACNRLFLGQLESLVGGWPEAKAALDAGAKLRRVSIRSSSPFPGSESGFAFHHYLPSCLRSLSVYIPLRGSPDYLRQLSLAAPNITYLDITFVVKRRDDRFKEIMERNSVSLSRLPLTLLALDCTGPAVERGTTPQSPLQRQMHAFSTAFVASAPELCPTLQIIMILYRSWQKFFHGGVGRFQEMGDLCGMNHFLLLHEWQWWEGNTERINGVCA